MAKISTIPTMALAVVLLLSLSRESLAEVEASDVATESAFELLQKCKPMLAGKELAELQLILCSGFIDGVVRGLNVAWRFAQVALQPIKTIDRPLICLPAGSTVGQVKLVFEAWAAKNPEKLHYPAALGVALAAIEAFPCAR